MAEAGEVSETNQTIDFSFVVSVSADPGEDVILPVRLSAETSALSMNISWLRGTELLYQYKSEMESTNNDCESRVSLSIQELERGNLSLTLRNVQESDSGEYKCQVYHNGCQKTVIVHLQVRGERLLQREKMEQQRQIKKLMLEGQIKKQELENQIKELEQEKQIMKLEMEKQIKELEMGKQIRELEMEKQIKELEQERQIRELEMKRQIMELERRTEDLEGQIKELSLPTHTLHGPTPRRRHSIHGLPPNVSEEDTPETPETEEERETRDTSGEGRESGDQNTTQTEEETTATDQETPGTSSQVLRAGTSVISSERATQTQEDPGATVQMDQDRRQESESEEEEEERSSTDK